MITTSFAKQFAEHWLTSWNCHDLDAILSHYAEDFEMISPYISSVAHEPSGILKGKKSVKDYWNKALSIYPKLHFEFINVLCGMNSIVINYKGLRGVAAETFILNSDGLVVKAIAHYE